MKIALDESVPEGLVLYLLGHDVKSIREMGIKGTKNGKLLDLIEEGKFDTFITADKRMESEQNFAQRPFAILLLSTNNWKLIKPHATAVAQALDQLKAGQITKVDCGPFVPKKFRK